MSVSSAFDPYITPGFPGVVFDSGGGSFSFAGHVNSVVHRISPTEMSTEISMNFVRTLREAAHITIPHPLSVISEVIHFDPNLSEIYQAILGCNCISFEDLEERILTSKSYNGKNAVDADRAIREAREKQAEAKRREDEVAEGKQIDIQKIFEDMTSDLTVTPVISSDENNNIRKAYEAKRRNIVTFEQYCKFMELTPIAGMGPEGEKTPILLNGEYVDDRREIDVYAVFEEQILPPEEENLSKTVEGSEANKEAKKAETPVGPTTTPSSTTTTTTAASPSGIVEQTKEEKAKLEEAKKKQKEEEEAKKYRESALIKPRELLRIIAEKEFSRIIYN